MCLVMGKTCRTAEKYGECKSKEKPVKGSHLKSYITAISHHWKTTPGERRKKKVVLGRSKGQTLLALEQKANPFQEKKGRNTSCKAADLLVPRGKKEGERNGLGTLGS